MTLLIGTMIVIERMHSHQNDFRHHPMWSTSLPIVPTRQSMSMERVEILTEYCGRMISKKRSTILLIYQVLQRLKWVSREYVSVACHTLCEMIQANSLDHIQFSLAYQVAQAIADMHDVEDDGYASIAHSK